MARRPISVRNASQSSKPAAKGFTASHPVNNQTNETLLVQHITNRQTGQHTDKAVNNNGVL